MFSLWGTTAGNLIMTFLISMVPVLELRAAIPLGVINGLGIWAALIVAIIGNLVPVPFIIIFIRKIFKWMQSKSERLARLVKKFEDKANARKDKVLKYEFWGLMVLVAVPLPGTGAWTGTLAASFLDMDFKKSVLACMGGVLLAGVIMGVLSALGVSAFNAAF